MLWLQRSLRKKRNILRHTTSNSCKVSNLISFSTTVWATKKQSKLAKDSRDLDATNHCSPGYPGTKQLNIQAIITL